MEEHKMKRLRFAFVLLICTQLSMTLVAVDRPILDFNRLSVKDSDNEKENRATYRDFSGGLGEGYSDEQLEMMNTSLFSENWLVELVGSSDFIENDRLSYAKVTPVEENSRKYPGLNVLGIRAHFPRGNFHSNIKVKPPFVIPAYEVAGVQLDGSTFNLNGLLTNVGVVRSVKVNVLGRNYPVRMIIVFKNAQDKELRIDMGFLDFKGWTEVEWRNPLYTKQVGQRELESAPLYPYEISDNQTLRLDRIIFIRDALFPDITDFIAYIRDIRVVFDTATIESLVDINDEGTWGILYDRQVARGIEETNALGARKILEVLDEEKRDRSDEAGAVAPPPAAPVAPPADAAAAPPA